MSNHDRRPGSLAVFIAASALIAGCPQNPPPPDTRGDSSANESGFDAAPDDAAIDVRPDVPVDLPVLPPPAPCTESSVGDPRRFPPCGLGAGVFGRWIVDAHGLPAYEYMAAQEHDARARFPNSQNLDRREHWHQLGNDRITASVYNDGYVQLLGQERGATWYNRFSPEQQNFAGGFGFVNAGRAWATAYRFRPEGSVTRRVFGLGYAEFVTEYDGLRITRHTYAPPGDAAALLTDVSIENLGDVPRPVQYFEYWDVNRHQLVFQLLRGGTFARSGDIARDGYNTAFDQSVEYDAAAATVRATMVHNGAMPIPVENEVSNVDSYPRDVFLAALVGSVREVYSDQTAFFGAGGPARPDAVVTPRTGELLSPRPGTGQPACLIMRTDTMVSPGTPARLRYAYGYTRRGTAIEIPATWRDPAHDMLAETIAWWRGRLAYFSSSSDPVLHREVAWRSYYLQSASASLDYFQTHTVAQGATYLYLHGFDGAPRDQALFAMPLAYINPRLSRELLTFIMAMTRSSTGGISYSYHGHGVLESANIHTNPSDLDIYFLMALTEYLAATGDRAFLAERVPFYPRGAPPPMGLTGDTVLDHARGALRHLVDVIGVGEHGLIRVGTGDWNDGISLVLGIDGRANTIARGESHANTAMAAAVLPAAADVLAAADPALATELRARGQAALDALRREWTGRWYPRAWLRNNADQAVRIGHDTEKLWLETQPWALLANAPDATQRATLEREIDERLDRVSPIGALIQEPIAGSEESAQAWPAVNGILTWAYARSRPDLAWRAVQRNTNAAHAEAYPEIWYGIWSAPDGINGVRSQSPGYTWASLPTPMTDFPVQNMNPDAMGLLGVLRVAGIEPVGDGLRIQPVVPGGPFVLDVALIRLEAGPGRVAGEYRAANDGELVLHVALPAGAVVDRATVRGTAVTPGGSARDATLALTYVRADRVAFELTYH